MNFKTTSEILFLLKGRVDKLIHEVNTDSKLSENDDLREWVFHCKRELTEIHYKLNKLEDDLLYDKISLDMEFTELEKILVKYLCSVNYIKEHINIISSKIALLEIKVIEAKGIED